MHINKVKGAFFLLIISLIAAGIAVYAAVNQQVETRHREQVESDQPDTGEDSGIEEISRAEESEESRETISDTEDKGTDVETQPESNGEVQSQITEEELTGQRTAEILSQMTIEEKVAQMFFITPEQLTGADNVTATEDSTKAALDRYPVGGLVYFAKICRRRSRRGACCRVRRIT